MSRGLQSEEVITACMLVNINGLTGRKDLNGQTGSLLDYDDAAGRFCVAMVVSGDVMRVKPGNLTRLTRERVNIGDLQESLEDYGRHTVFRIVGALRVECDAPW